MLIQIFIFSYQVVSSEFIIHHSAAPGSDFQLKKINNQLTKTWSSPFLYDPQAIPRVPPILSQQDSSSGFSRGRILLFTQVQANPKKIAQKRDAIFSIYGETGLTHDIFFEFSLRPFEVVEAEGGRLVYDKLEIKPCGLGSRIRYMEAE